MKHIYMLLIAVQYIYISSRTPLHWAAAMGKSEAVSSLLELNANPNPVDLEQGTPLDYARQSGHAGKNICWSSTIETAILILLYKL